MSDDDEMMTAEASSSEGGERPAQSCSLSRLWQAIEQDDLEAARSAIAQETTLSFEHAQWHFRSVEMLKLLLTKTWQEWGRRCPPVGSLKRIDRLSPGRRPHSGFIEPHSALPVNLDYANRHFEEVW